MAEVQEAVILLDVPAHGTSSWIHVYRLKHLQAVPTARALHELATDSSALRGASDVPPPKIVADAQTNALLVEATPRGFEQLKAILDELDKPELDHEEER